MDASDLAAPRNGSNLSGRAVLRFEQDFNAAKALNRLRGSSSAPPAAEAR